VQVAGCFRLQRIEIGSNPFESNHIATVFDLILRLVPNSTSDGFRHLAVLLQYHTGATRNKIQISLTDGSSIINCHHQLVDSSVINCGRH
jgi:hypothetical protein